MTLDELKEFEKKINALKTEYLTEGKKILTENLAEVFSETPTVRSISWKQRGPDFSDGDYSGPSVETDCFRVTVDSEEATDDDYDDEEDDDNEVYLWSGNREADDNERVTAARKLSALMNAVGEDILFALYGEDVKVTLTRNGKTTTEEYYPY